MVNKIVRTERLELVDRHGRPRVVLACEEETGAPTCAFLDAEGRSLGWTRPELRTGGQVVGARNSFASGHLDWFALRAAPPRSGR